MATLIKRHTTIRLTPSLMLEAKNYAYKQGLSFTGLIEMALKNILTTPAKKAIPPRAFKLHRFKGKGVQPGVQLDSFSSLLDKMEGLDAATRR